MPHRRGVAVALDEMLATPPGILHYEPGPVTYRQAQINGARLLVTYKAQWDGVGWLVYDAHSRALVIAEGDIVHIRVRVAENHGDVILVETDDGRSGKTIRQVAVSSVVFIEEAKDPREWPEAGEVQPAQA